MTINTPWKSSHNPPESTDQVFVAYLDDVYGHIDYTTGVYNGGWVSDNDMGGNNVIAWMEIPKISVEDIERLFIDSEDEKFKQYLDK